MPDRIVTGVFHTYKNADGGYVVAERGEVISVSAQEAERGEAFGVLADPSTVNEDGSRDLGSLKVDELKQMADDLGISVPAGAKKDDIVALLEQETGQ